MNGMTNMTGSVGLIGLGAMGRGMAGSVLRATDATCMSLMCAEAVQAFAR
jgi:3-hydroxyisobutyrate dehydrogenase-like beta-hydroxyacid dehydrogenase